MSPEAGHLNPVAREIFSLSRVCSLQEKLLGT